jgi:hypothetical protein
VVHIRCDEWELPSHWSTSASHSPFGISVAMTSKTLRTKSSVNSRLTMERSSPWPSAYTLMVKYNVENTQMRETERNNINYQNNLYYLIFLRHQVGQVFSTIVITEKPNHPTFLNNKTFN